MTDQSPNPQPSSDAILVQLSQAEYRCPLCNEVVLKVEGNELKFLGESKTSAHTSDPSIVKDGDNVYIILQLRHIDKPDIQPGHIIHPSGWNVPDIQPGH